MRCPVCRAVLITVEYRLVEMDCCASCGGTWLDSGELEIICGGLETCVQCMDEDTKSPAASAKRKCPICSKQMRTLRTQGQPSVVYDRCDKHGLWLDKGELDQVLAHGAVAPGGVRVDDFLRETFDLKKGDE